MDIKFWSIFHSVLLKTLRVITQFQWISSSSLNIGWVPIHTIREMLKNRQEKFYPMVIGALQKFCDAN